MRQSGCQHGVLADQHRTRLLEMLDVECGCRAGELIHQADDPALCVEPGIGLEPGGHGAEQLTRREHEIAGLAAAGVPSREIVERLFLSIRTVDNHLQNVYAKLGITSREELARVLR